jgi:predicted HicB family RNase H-like nuclease
MNNFVFSQDPLLYGQTITPHPPTDMDIKRQLDTVLAQYQSMQQKTTPEPPVEDHIGSLDNMMKNLDPSLLESLEANAEFIQLNAWIQQAIQAEIMKGVKSQLNVNPEVISKVSRAKDIIQEIKNIQDIEDRKSLSELNEYITHYSDMTFNEYKQLKLSKQNQ